MWNMYWMGHGDRFFSPNTYVFLYHHHHPTNGSTCCSYKDKRAMPGNLPQSSAKSEIGEHWIEEYLNIFVFRGLQWRFHVFCYSTQQFVVLCRLLRQPKIFLSFFYVKGKEVMEQRANIKFCLKLRKTAEETYKIKFLKHFLGVEDGRIKYVSTQVKVLGFLASLEI